MPLLAAMPFGVSLTLLAAQPYPEGYATVMKIPLNAPVQEVVDALDREGATFTGASEEKNRAAQLQLLRKDLSEAHDPYSQTNKEAALKVFDENANQLLPSFSRGDRKYFMAPSSFRCLADTYIYSQVFQKNCTAYVSQYALFCESLPPSLKLFGMSQMWIVFASFDGQPPRSCMVAFANPRYPGGLKGLPTV